MIEMLVPSRPGHVELLPALPTAWAGDGRVRGAGVRGGFVLDLRRRNGTPVEAGLHSVGGRTTTVAYAGTTRRISLAPGGSATLRNLAR
ncbi:glycoside hydrolase family 95-like protein [Streptomyces sp. NPDC012466]|jgi:alpha-L-fucosidase 2|uniref:glycoside hydrolase family 95-like protein n=1 Tax=Streptomyces sp. NPDC012466 TaxID=3364835 RepID=UPI0036EE16B3